MSVDSQLPYKDYAIGSGTLVRFRSSVSEGDYTEHDVSVLTKDFFHSLACLQASYDWSLEEFQFH